jgi:UDP-3-O-[3-hydroxymyristoyl] glucosamine N-acyltransferase
MTQEAYTLAELTKLIGAELRGDADCKIFDIASLASAKAGDVSFLSDKKHAHLLKTTKASAIVLPQECAELCATNALVVPNPKLDFIKLTELFKPRLSSPKPSQHPTAIVGENCEIDKSVHLGAYVVVGDHVKIGAHTVIRSGTNIGDHVNIGESCCLYSRVTVYDDITIGNNAIIHSGVVIGADGFGFAPNEKQEWVKIPQVGRVIIGNDVEVGANTTIDRGALDDTRLGDGVKIDNLVMIAHNVEIGDHTLISGCTGIAGSTTIGKHCTIGGAVSIGGHIYITDYSVLAGGATVIKSIIKPGAYASTMLVQPLIDGKKGIIHYWKLGDLFKRVKKLETAQDNDK